MFKSWLLNVVGIVFAGAILDMVMPDGKTNKFINLERGDYVVQML